MGSVEIEGKTLTIYSHIITYGNVATPQLTEMIRDEIETMWNEPVGSLKLEGLLFNVVFRISASYQPNILDLPESRSPQQLFSHRRICPRQYFIRRWTWLQQRLLQIGKPLQRFNYCCT
jgi:hypothetical protein